MQTLETPDRMTRRELVAQLLETLPPTQVDDVRLRFVGEQYPTTSYMDELIRQTLADGRTQRLTLIDADEFTVELAREAAERYGVTERLVALSAA